MRISREDLLAYVSEAGKLHDKEWMAAVEEAVNIDYSIWDLIKLWITNPKHAWRGFKLGLKR